MKVLSEKVLALKEGEVLLHRIRKVYRKDAGGQGVNGSYKMSLEFIGNVRLPNQIDSVLTVFNQGDERFGQYKKFVYAYLIAEPEVAANLLNLDLENFNELKVSTGLPAHEWVEFVHFLSVDMLNPAVPDKGRLFVQFVETTNPPSLSTSPLVNPKSGDVVLDVNGKPIYTNHQVVFASSADEIQHYVVPRMSRTAFNQMLLGSSTAKEEFAVEAG